MVISIERRWRQYDEVHYRVTPPATTGTGLSISWRELPLIPPNRNGWSDAIPVNTSWWQQIGLGGPVTGVQDNLLLVAGGTNFPEPGLTVTRPNTLGKVYWDEVFVLKLDDQMWMDQTYKLPKALAYSATVSLPEGVLVIGGEGFEHPNGNAIGKLQLFNDVFLMRLDDACQKLEITAYPSLPKPMSYATAALVGRTIFVHGGADFFCLNLDSLVEGWKPLDVSPGEARSVALAAGVGGKFMLASGRSIKDGVGVIYRDLHAYDPDTARWTALPAMAIGAMAGMAFSVMDRYFVVVGGDGNVERWNRYLRLETERSLTEHRGQIWTDTNSAVTFLHDHHTGFNRCIQVYDRQTQSWSDGGYLPCSAPVTTQPVQWNGEFLLIAGEISPGKRTPSIWAGRPWAL